VTLSGRKGRDPSDLDGTLGALLYPAHAPRRIPESEWEQLVRGIAAGDQLALHDLYDRTHRIVFTLIQRIVGDSSTAEELTVDVFHDVWRRAATYDPASGTVVGWIMNQARSRAIDRHRFEHRKKRMDPDPHTPSAANDLADATELLELRDRAQRLRSALTLLAADERAAIETTFFAGLTHIEAAQQLGQPLGTVKTKIRAGLEKLRVALEKGVKSP
jgi:RNA polymerase sigma-70 factor, ECF subfamily